VGGVGILIEMRRRGLAGFGKGHRLYLPKFDFIGQVAETIILRRIWMPVAFALTAS